MDQIGLETTEVSRPEKQSANAEIKAGKPHMLELQSNPVQPTNEGTDTQPTLPTSLEPTQKLSQVGAPKSQSGLQAVKASTVGQGLAVDETPDKQSVVSNVNRKQKPDHGGKKRVTSKISTKNLSKADSKLLINIESENRAEVLVSVKQAPASQEPSPHVELLKVEQRTAKNSPIPRAITSPLKRSRKQNSKAMGEEVTDEEWAELEAENAHLKLLLQEKLKSESST